MANNSILILGLLAIFFVSFYLSNALFLPYLIDKPNTRSLHKKPTSRAGGIAILIGIIVGNLIIIFLSNNLLFQIPITTLTGFICVVLISFFDDRQGIIIRWRIIIHLLAANLVVIGLVADNFDLSRFNLSLSNWLRMLFSLLLVVWLINLYNFMDGMDGFAGGMAVIGFSTLAWLGRADADFTAFCLIVAAASAGFLVHNFPPAKIFMGDTGSTALGFLVAACSLGGSKAGLFPLWIALLVFSPFIVDATVTLLRRVFRGERFWEAHRSHYYQRLVLLGWGHRRTVLAEYVLMLACAGSAMAATKLSSVGQISLLIAWAFIYLLLMAGVERLERRATVAPP